MKIARVRAPGQELTDLIDDTRRVRDLLRACRDH